LTFPATFKIFFMKKAMFKKILLTTDGSPFTEKTIQLALNVANKYGSKLLALYAMGPYPYLGIGEVNPSDSPWYKESENTFATDAHQFFMKIAKKKFSAVQVECLSIECKSSSDAIIQTSVNMQCDLIVIGSQPHGALGRLMFGNVSSKVVNDSLIPVMVIR
jgi:nucleotide-binding universal stress UspA family protein